MNLSKLFEMQRQLDDHIMDEHPELKGQDNLDWKILALQVELGECANEWRGFKKWSKDQEPRTREVIDCPICVGTGDVNAEANMESMMEGKGGEPYEACEDCNETGIAGYRNPLLEEYVDGLHFILSIGLEMGFDYINFEKEIEEYNKSGVTFKDKTVTAQFINMFHFIALLEDYRGRGNYREMTICFIRLGEMLGFTWKEVEQAYFDKNAINHQRQEAGY